MNDIKLGRISQMLMEKPSSKNGPSILNTPILIQRERTDATKLERIPGVLQTPSFGPLVIQPQASLNFG
jgi:hypothetical protein